MSIINQNLLLTPEGYQISRSVRLRSSASAYLNRTPAVASNQKTWTWSGWVKRGKLGVQQGVFEGYSSATALTSINFGASDVLSLQLYTNPTYNTVWSTTAVFRDPSAWYHIVVVLDTTQASQANMAKLYVNGVQQTFTYTNFNSAIPQNSNWYVNATNPQYIGTYVASNYIDGYFTEVNFIDGQALTPSSFGEFDGATGVWKPKKYLGTYGTNGFYLNFSDNSAATAAAIGKDSSGNGNNWTPNNISVTAGVTYDSMLDVPTPYADGGNGRGNYLTINPLQTRTSWAASNGNLTWTNSGGGADQYGFLWDFVNGQKIYYEMTATTIPTQDVYKYAGDNAAYYCSNGQIYVGGSLATTAATFTSGDILGFAVTVGSEVKIYKNGSLIYTASVAASGAPLLNGYGGTVWNVNFGQRPFYGIGGNGLIPSSYVTLNTQNLPDSTIKKGNQYFDATAYTGDGASTRTITNAAGFAPDLVWLKSRNAGNSHLLYDTIRGASTSGSSKALSSNLTTAEGGLNDDSTYGYLSAFVSNGFSVVNGSTGAYTNVNTNTYVGWQWKKGATQGFDIVTYTGDGTANRTVPHALGVVPAMVIIKSRNYGSAGWDWLVYHKALNTSTEYLLLDSTAAKASAAGAWAHTSSNLVFPTAYQTTNSAGVTSPYSTFVAYCWAEVAGFSKFGSYTGNGSTDGPFVWCGFRPRYLMVKRTDTAGYNWIVWDSIRDTYNQEVAELYPSLPDAEGNSSTNGRPLDFLSNGFKWRGTNAIANASGGTYIFAAFAESPFKVALAR